MLMIGDECKVGGIKTPSRPELVPEVVYFDSARHTAVMADLLRDFTAGNHLLLLGSQGVGKNKLADRMLQLLQREREYMQLHRDVSVAALTQTPSLTSGMLVWEDSPLVRAIEHGRVLVLDEADKAPLEVTCVLRSLFSDGQMALADGRRVAPHGTPPAPGILPIASGFRAIVLANRPGYPFLGNDFFRECGDVLSSHTVFNPDIPSEVQLLQRYGPDVPVNLLKRVAKVFSELRGMSEGGELAYPFSTREAVSLVRHMQAYPNDGLLGAADNIFSFDSHQPQLASSLAATLRRNGIPAGGRGSTEPFALKLAPTEPLPPSVPLESWAAAADKASGGEIRLSTEYTPLVREAGWTCTRDPPDPIDALQFGRMRVFTEEVMRWRLPNGVKSEAVSSLTIASDGSTHVLTSSYAGLHLFSFASNGQGVTHASIGRGSGTFGGLLRRPGAPVDAGLHALPHSMGGGLLLHLRSSSQLLHISPLAPEEEERMVVVSRRRKRYESHRIPCLAGYLWTARRQTRAAAISRSSPSFRPG